MREEKGARKRADPIGKASGNLEKALETMSRRLLTQIKEGETPGKELGELAKVMKQAFEQRRDHLVERMNQIDGVSCLKPDGAFYVMMNLEKLIGRTLGGRVIHNADDFAMAFLEKGLVAVVSCCAFDAPNFVRWTYATSLETIKEGLDRLEKFLKEG